MNLRLRRLVLAAACVATALAPRADAQGRASNRQVVVSAAVSLTEVLQQLGPAFQAAAGDRLVLNVAASNTLARQISFGAGVDLFISADEAQMNAVAAYIDPASRVELVGNQLAIAVPDDRPRAMTSARDLLDPAIRRIAIGDPAAVPAGVYAKQYLQTLGIWPDLASKIVPSGSVRLALMAVGSGAGRPPILYPTHVATPPPPPGAAPVRFPGGPRLRVPPAAGRGGKNPEGG